MFASFLVAAFVYNKITKKSLVKEIYGKIPCLSSNNDNTENTEQNDEDEAVPIKPTEPEATVIDETVEEQNKKQETNWFYNLLICLFRINIFIKKK